MANELSGNTGELGNKLLEARCEKLEQLYRQTLAALMQAQGVSYYDAIRGADAEVDAVLKDGE